MSAKGDNFCDFRFALLHAKSLLKGGLLYKESKCIPYSEDLSLEWDKNKFERAVSPEGVYILLKMNRYI